MRRLPPLIAIRAFEAAARHLSFTRAAQELHVTQAAISHQVKQLEEWLGLRLFERYGHSLALTPQGKAYLPELSRALDALAAATARLSGPALAGPLRLSVLPSFAARWLLPRLSRFRAAHPDIDLQVNSSAALCDFGSGEADLAIRSGLGRWPGLKAELISREALAPLGSPALLQAGPPLKVPDDLAAYPLLHDTPRDAWPRWLELAGATRPDGTAGSGFSDSAHVLQAAVEGQGVALGRLFLAADDLAAGRLVRPFPLALPNDYSYWLVYPKASAGQPRLAAFRDWLLAEAAGTALTA